MTEHEVVAASFLERLAELTGGCTPSERFIMQVFPGDPGEAKDNAWRPRAWRPGDLLPASPERTNGYVAISTFRRAPDQSWRRQKALFASCRMIMIDDVGTKVHPARAAAVPPTWRVLTSPGNEQWLYLLKGGSTDRELVDAIINGLVDQALLPQDAKDPGMKGVTRVARVPGFINGKANYGGNFRVRWAQESGPLHTVEGLMRGFNLQVRPRRTVQRTYVRIAPAEHADRLLMFNLTMKHARRCGLVVRERPNASGWIAVRCPWEHEHTHGKDGADIREPALENDFYGAFRCHHGHCDGRGWREFTDALGSSIANDLSAANESWGRYE